MSVAKRGSAPPSRASKLIAFFDAGIHGLPHVSHRRPACRCVVCRKLDPVSLCFEAQTPSCY